MAAKTWDDVKPLTTKVEIHPDTNSGTLRFEKNPSRDQTWDRGGKKDVGLPNPNPEG